MNSVNDQKTPARAWGILAISYIASWAAALAQFKVPALADSLIPAVIVGPAGGDPVFINTYFGLLMSALTIIVAFPLGPILAHASLGYHALYYVCIVAVILSFVLGSKALQKKQDVLMAEWEEEIATARKANAASGQELDSQLYAAAPAATTSA